MLREISFLISNQSFGRVSPGCRSAGVVRTVSEYFIPEPVLSETPLSSGCIHPLLPRSMAALKLEAPSEADNGAFPGCNHLFSFEYTTIIDGNSTSVGRVKDNVRELQPNCLAISRPIVFFPSMRFVSLSVETSTILLFIVERVAIRLLMQWPPPRNWHF